MRTVTLLVLVACSGSIDARQPDAGVDAEVVGPVDPAIQSVSVPPKVEVEGATGVVVAAVQGPPGRPLTVVFSGSLGTYAPSPQLVTTNATGHGTAAATFTAGPVDGTEAGMVAITSPLAVTPVTFGFPVTPFARYGNTQMLPTPGPFSPNILVGMPIVVPASGKLRKLGFLSAGAGPSIKIGIYADVGGNPGALVAQMPATAILQGRNEVPLATPVNLAAGTYWFMAVYSASGTVYFQGNVGAGAVVKDVALPFANELPATFPAGHNTYTGQSFDYYLVVGT